MFWNRTLAVLRVNNCTHLHCVKHGKLEKQLRALLQSIDYDTEKDVEAVQQPGQWDSGSCNERPDEGRDHSGHCKYEFKQACNAEQIASAHLKPTLCVLDPRARNKQHKEVEPVHEQVTAPVPFGNRVRAL